MTTFTAPAIASIENNELRQQLQQIVDLKTKPLGALGRLETLALQLGMIQGITTPHIDQPQIRVFAADLGCWVFQAACSAARFPPGDLPS